MFESTVSTRRATIQRYMDIFHFLQSQASRVCTILTGPECKKAWSTTEFSFGGCFIQTWRLKLSRPDAQNETRSNRLASRKYMFDQDVSCSRNSFPRSIVNCYDPRICVFTMHDWHDGLDNFCSSSSRVTVFIYRYSFSFLWAGVYMKTYGFLLSKLIMSAKKNFVNEIFFNSLTGSFLD